MTKRTGMRAVTVAIVLLGCLFVTKQVSAECWTGLPSNGPDPAGSDVCVSIDESPWKSSGTEYYACSTDYIGSGGALLCYWHPWKCTDSCGAVGVPGACFVPGTMVSNASGGKRIEEIQVGDSVTSFEEDRLVNSSVSQIYKTQRDYYFEIVAGEYGVSVTAEHPFYIGNGSYEETQNLKVGDTLYVQEDGEMRPKTIDMIRRVDEKTDVYNMSVDGTHTYFANDFAVHNKTSYVGPTCASGTSLSCDTANPTYACYKYRGSCDELFPSSWTPQLCDASSGDSILCNNSCGCCAPGQNFTCNGPVYSHVYTSYQTTENNKGELVAVDPKQCADGDDAYISTAPWYNIPPDNPSPLTVNTCKWQTECIRNCGSPAKVEVTTLVGCMFTSSCKQCEGCAATCDDTAPTPEQNLVLPSKTSLGRIENLSREDLKPSLRGFFLLGGRSAHQRSPLKFHSCQHLLELLARVKARQKGRNLAGAHGFGGIRPLRSDLQPEIAEIAQFHNVPRRQFLRDDRQQGFQHRHCIRAGYGGNFRNPPRHLAQGSAPARCNGRVKLPWRLQIGRVPALDDIEFHCHFCLLSK